MAQVMDRSGGEGALGALDVQLVLAQDVEDDAQVLKVLGPGRAVNEDIIEEDEDAPAEERLEDEVDGALDSLKGMTKNSKWPW